ncbi:hypothetical protein FQR65_LT06399 [Abscondita terminalis]|nr:hypothetical protein FQR65_LT06399 [Abscondita terminalis]
MGAREVPVKRGFTVAYYSPHKENPLKDNDDNVVYCRGSILPCPKGYKCRGGLCCPITSVTSTSSKPIDCPEFPDCSGGIIEYDENGCRVCLIVDTCPGFPCPENYYCTITNITLHNITLGNCYVNPCASGSPLVNNDGYSMLCNFNENQDCPNEYICTPTDINNSVCCPTVTTSSSTATGSSTTVTSYFNPCASGSPLVNNDGYSVLCDFNENLNCPNGYICTPTDISNSVCCPLPTTSSSTTTASSTIVTNCPEFPDCTGGITEYDENGCRVCLFVDTCPGFPCPENYYCANTNITLDNNIVLGNCYVNPCASGSPLLNNAGYSVLCSFNENVNCPSEYICTPTDIGNSVCCPSTATSSSTITTSTT